MLRKATLGALLACLLVAPASAQVTVEMNQITCKDFAGYDDDMKAFVAAWMGGYFSASRNLNVVQSRYVKRNLEKVGQYCTKHKNDSLLGVVEKVAH